VKAGRPRLFADDPIVVRLTTETIEHLDAVRFPGEARSAAARRILADALSRVRS
jgi:hypothetical protein